MSKPPQDHWSSPPQETQSPSFKLTSNNLQVMQNAMTSNRFGNNREASMERKIKPLVQKAPKIVDANQQAESSANPGTFRVFRNNYKEQVAA